MDNRARYKIKQRLEHRLFEVMEELLPIGIENNASELEKFYDYLADKPNDRSWKQHIEAACNRLAWSAKFSFNDTKVANDVAGLADQFGTSLERMEDRDVSRKAYILDLLKEKSYQMRMRKDSMAQLVNGLKNNKATPKLISDINKAENANIFEFIIVNKVTPKQVVALYSGRGKNGKLIELTNVMNPQVSEMMNINNLSFDEVFNKYQSLDEKERRLWPTQLNLGATSLLFSLVKQIDENTGGTTQIAFKAGKVLLTAEGGMDQAAHKYSLFTTFRNLIAVEKGVTQGEFSPDRSLTMTLDFNSLGFVAQEYKALDKVKSWLDSRGYTTDVGNKNLEMAFSQFEGFPHSVDAEAFKKQFGISVKAARTLSKQVGKKFYNPFVLALSTKNDLAMETLELYYKEAGLTSSDGNAKTFIAETRAPGQVHESNISVGQARAISKMLDKRRFVAKVTGKAPEPSFYDDGVAFADPVEQKSAIAAVRIDSEVESEIEYKTEYEQESYYELEKVPVEASDVEEVNVAAPERRNRSSFWTRFKNAVWYVVGPVLEFLGLGRFFVRRQEPVPVATPAFEAMTKLVRKTRLVPKPKLTRKKKPVEKREAKEENVITEEDIKDQSNRRVEYLNAQLAENLENLRYNVEGGSSYHMGKEDIKDVDRELRQLLRDPSKALIEGVDAFDPNERQERYSYNRFSSVSFGTLLDTLSIGPVGYTFLQAMLPENQEFFLKYDFDFKDIPLSKTHKFERKTPTDTPTVLDFLSEQADADFGIGESDDKLGRRNVPSPGDCFYPFFDKFKAPYIIEKSRQSLVHKLQNNSHNQEFISQMLTDLGVSKEQQKHYKNSIDDAFNMYQLETDIPYLLVTNFLKRGIIVHTQKFANTGCSFVRNDKGEKSYSTTSKDLFNNMLWKMNANKKLGWVTSNKPYKETKYTTNNTTKTKAG